MWLVFQTPRRRSAASSPKTEIHVEFTKCISEVDISLVDRIHALLNPEPLAKCVNSVYMSAYKSFTNPAQVSLLGKLLVLPLLQTKQLILSTVSVFATVSFTNKLLCDECVILIHTGIANIIQLRITQYQFSFQ